MANDLTDAIKLAKDLVDLGHCQGVEFLSTKIHGGRLTNGELLSYLKDQGRDFTSFSERDYAQIKRVFDFEFEKGLRSLGSLNLKSFAVGLNKITQQALKKALMEMIIIIDKRLDAGTNFAGKDMRSVADLTDEYKDIKQRKWGFKYPIGTASGQLQKSIGTTEANKIKLIK